MKRPWNGWAQVRPAGKWHRVDYDSRTGLANVVCGLSMRALYPSKVYEYRWRPRFASDVCCNCTRLAEDPDAP